MKNAGAILGCAILAGTLGSAGGAWAHHSFAMFDFSKDVSLLGVVRTFDWKNPHIHIAFAVEDSQGRVQNWDIEGQTPNSLRPQGWSKTTLQPGDKVRLIIHPLKSGGLGGSLVRAVHPDGSPLVTPAAGGAGAAASAGQPG